MIWNNTILEKQYIFAPQSGDHWVGFKIFRKISHLKQDYSIK